MNGKRLRRAKVPPRSTGRQAVQQSKQASKQASERVRQTTACRKSREEGTTASSSSTATHDDDDDDDTHTLSLSHTRTAFERMMHTYKGRVMKKSVCCLSTDATHNQGGGCTKDMIRLTAASQR